MDLNTNFIKKVSYDKKGLFTLNLSGRKLTEIRSDTLNLIEKSKLKYQEIDLKNNEISKIEENVFHGQEHIKNLYLDQNKLIEINKALSNNCQI